jgi:hypothetical protein
MGNILISSSNRKGLTIIPLRSKTNSYGQRYEMNGFSFKPETKIIFRRYVSFSFSRSHDGKMKKRLKKVLQKQKEKRSSLPRQ